MRFPSLLTYNSPANQPRSVIKEAQRQFAAYTTGTRSAIHPSLRSAVFRIAVTEGGQSAYDAILAEYHATTSIDGKEICLTALGRVQTPELARAYLAFLFSPAVAVQDVHSGGAALAANAKARNVLWEFIQAEWDTKVFPTLSANMVVLERFLRISLTKFASYDVEQEMAKFFGAKDQRGFDRGVSVVRDTVKGNAKYKERDLETVRAWIRAHGYA